MVHWLIGDPFLVSERTEQLCADRPTVRLDGKQLDLSILENELSDMGLFSQERCLIVNRFSLAARTLASDRAKESFLRALRQKPESTLVILQSEEADMRTKVAKAIAKLGRKEDLKAPRDYQMRELCDFIGRRAAQHGLKLDARLTLDLLTLCGPNLGVIDSELAKLRLLIPSERNEVTQEDLEAVSKGASVVFRLGDAILRGDAGRATELLGEFLLAEEAPIRLLAIIVRSWEGAARYRNARRRGLPHEKAAGEAGVHPYVAKVNADASRDISDKALMEGIQALERADVALKRGGVPRTVLTLLILCLCRKIGFRQFRQMVAAYDL